MGSLPNQTLSENSCGNVQNKGKASVTRIFQPGCGPIISYVNRLQSSQQSPLIGEKKKLNTDIGFTNITRSSSEINFPKRRVTCVREFPSFCGRNAPCLTNEERLKIISTSGTEELTRVVVRPRDLKMSDSEKVLRPLKKTVREANLGSNLVTERAKTANKNYLFSYGEPSSSIKGGWKNTVGRKRTAAYTRNNLVSHRNPSNLVSRDSKTNQKRERVVDARKSNLGSHGNSPALIVAPQNVGTPNSARDKVKETLALFRALCEELLEKKAANVRKQKNYLRRIDMKAMTMIRESKKDVNTEIQWIGGVPGVEIGDEFLYRAELLIVGVHRQVQTGIDYLKSGSKIIATSVVASNTDGYTDYLGNSHVLIYQGHGGKGQKNTPHEDQKLEKGNLALKNSILLKNEVRVTRGFLKTDISDMENRTRVYVYTYDGLYTVEKYWSEVGKHGKLVYKFELRRIPGQPRVDWKRSMVKVQN